MAVAAPLPHPTAHASRDLKIRLCLSVHTKKSLQARIVRSEIDHKITECADGGAFYALISCSKVRSAGPNPAPETRPGTMKGSHTSGVRPLPAWKPTRTTHPEGIDPGSIRTVKRVSRSHRKSTLK